MKLTDVKEGMRVKPHDADKPSNIPAYRTMRGTVVGFQSPFVLVHWDMDGSLGSSKAFPENITEANDN